MLAWSFSGRKRKQFPHPCFCFFFSTISRIHKSANHKCWFMTHHQYCSCRFNLLLTIHCEPNSKIRTIPIIYVSQCAPSIMISSFFTFKVPTLRIWSFLCFKKLSKLCTVYNLAWFFNFVKGIWAVVAYIFLPFSFNIMPLTVIQALHVTVICFHHYITNHCVSILQFIYPFFSS